jgi:hypothetical protein
MARSTRGAAMLGPGPSRVRGATSKSGYVLDCIDFSCVGGSILLHVIEIVYNEICVLPRFIKISSCFPGKYLVESLYNMQIFTEMLP